MSELSLEQADTINKDAHEEGKKRNLALLNYGSTWFRRPY